MAAAARPTLLFAHGAGHCKEVWDPIIRRVLASPLLQRTPSIAHSFDFPYHGSKRDNSIAPRVFYAGPDSPRVSHPVSAWVATAAQGVENVVHGLQQEREREPTPGPLIGIGHSMGGIALWLTEIRHPGTFDGLILFEPMYGLASDFPPRILDLVVNATLRREAQWPSRAAALEHLKGFKNFKSWDRESLEAYAKGAVVDEPDGSAVLACHPHIEAASFCNFAGWFSPDESALPKCRVSFHGGERSPFYSVKHFEAMRERSPHIYTIHPPMPKCSHVMVVENPELAAQGILVDLAALPAYATTTASNNSSKL